MCCGNEGVDCVVVYEVLVVVGYYGVVVVLVVVVDDVYSVGEEGVCGVYD